jgi:hypothetical protein
MKNQLILLVASLLLGSHSFSQSNGNEMFDNTYVHEIRFTFEQENFWDSLEYYYYVAVVIEGVQDMLASVEIDGTFIDSVAIRQKGQFSNWGSDGLKEPFKVDFNEYVPGQKYDGLKKLNLQNGFADPSFMRDALSYKLMRDVGIAAPRTSYARVYLNDEYWGLYLLVEQIDDRFLKNWYEDNDGNLFKCMTNTEITWLGTDKEDYRGEFQLKTNEELDDWSEFIHFVDETRQIDEFDDSISTVLEMDNFLHVLAVDVLINNRDAYYSNGRNFYLYYDSTAQAFQWIPWDYNFAFSDVVWDVWLNYDGWGPGARPLLRNVMNSDLYREQYFDHLCMLIDNYFSLENYESFIDETEALIADAMEEDPNKFQTTEEFHNNIDSNVSSTLAGITFDFPGLKPFFTQRATQVLEQLSGYDHNCLSLGLVEENSEIKIYPNPSETGVFNVDVTEDLNEISVYSLVGQIVYHSFIDTETTAQIDLSSFADGVYIVELTGASKSVQKLVKN